MTEHTQTLATETAPQSAHEQAPLTLTWSAYEHEHIEREPDWFWALGIAALAGSVTSIVLGDILFALVIVLAAFIIGLIARTPPELATFHLSDKGLRINDKTHRFREMVAFWVEDEVHLEKPFLLIRMKKVMPPEILIPLENIDPAVVRAFMHLHVEEKHMQEPLFHHILAWFGF